MKKIEKFILEVSIYFLLGIVVISIVKIAYEIESWYMYVIYALCLKPAESLSRVIYKFLNENKKP